MLGSKRYRQLIVETLFALLGLLVFCEFIIYYVILFQVSDPIFTNCVYYIMYICGIIVKQQL